MRKRSCFIYAVLFSALSAMVITSGATAVEPWPGETHFSGLPPDALAHRIIPGSGCGWDNASGNPSPPSETASSIVVRDPNTGLELHQTRTWLEETPGLLIKTTLINPTANEIPIAPVHLLQHDIKLYDISEEARYRPLTYNADTWYGSTFWTGPDWTRVGKDWHHPGEATPSIRCFTAPQDGHVTITGQVRKADVNCGDGIIAAIRHNTREIWTGTIEGADANGLEARVELDVHTGDFIRFVIGKRGEIPCDTTYWNPTITYSSGPAFTAADGFSTTPDAPTPPWSYEMDTVANQPKPPRITTFTKKSGMAMQTLDAEQPISLNATNAWPLTMLWDDQRPNGLILAAEPHENWTLNAALEKDGRLTLDFLETPGGTLAPGASLTLPAILFTGCEGSWRTGLFKLDQLVQTITPLQTLLPAIMTCARETMPIPTRASAPEDFTLACLIQEEWLRQDKLDQTYTGYSPAAQTQIAKTRQLLQDLGTALAPDVLAAYTNALAAFEPALASGAPETDTRAAYYAIRQIKRAIALNNPLLSFGPLLFCKRTPTSYSHLVMQYYGWRARPGGGLYILDRPGASTAVRAILPPEYAAGCVLEPRLSYDAKRIVFSYVANAGREYDPNQLNNDVDEAFYHIYEINVDGTGLHQLTAGPYDDLMPAYLPDGGIVFSSTRRKGYARCFGAQFSPRWHVYTLHRMNADGTNLHPLSYHDTNEWFPVTGHDGRIIYSRWDYIDRDAVTHQNLWATRPDGTDAVAIWGNATDKPHCTFQIQPVPNSPKFIITASAHHSIAGGPLILLDPTVADNGPAAITRLTPEIPFPEAETRAIYEYYDAPWPLSEKYFLTAYSSTPLVWEPGANPSDALGLYLLDAAGNRELLYRDPAIGCTNPCPLIPRQAPPTLPTSLPSPPSGDTGEFMLADVYQGLGDVPRGTIKALRVVQIFPKSTPIANAPPIGDAHEENGRAILGTVPVAEDGSARFTAPAGKPLLFQALDENGMAYQTMRSITYLQPGERLSCTGCHESRMTSPPPKRISAIQNPPAPITPGPFDGAPFSFMRVVQPILDAHCTTCHSGEKPKAGRDLTGTPHNGYTRSYWALCEGIPFMPPEDAAKVLVPRFSARNQIQVTPPGGQIGARGSRLLKMLREGHHDVKLTPEETARLAMWIDSNAIFYGINDPAMQAKLLQGETVPMPDLQ